MYAAIENGYFEDEGLDITLNTGFGADKTMTAVLSGEADIGFMGSEAVSYTHLDVYKRQDLLSASRYPHTQYLFHCKNSKVISQTQKNANNVNPFHYLRFNLYFILSQSTFLLL